MRTKATNFLVEVEKLPHTSLVNKCPEIVRVFTLTQMCREKKDPLLPEAAMTFMGRKGKKEELFKIWSKILQILTPTL